MKLQTIKSSEMVDSDFYSCMEKMIDQTKGFPISEPKYTHTFSNGLYIREARVKKGALVIGAIHKKETVAILAEGKMQNLTKNGVILVEAYKMLITPPGMQRASLTLTDVTFMTLHRTDAMSVEEFEDEWIIGGHRFLLGGDSNPQTIKNGSIYESNKQLS
jgi:hypothetical protein